MKKSLLLATNRRPILYCLFSLLIVLAFDGCQGCRHNGKLGNLNEIRKVNSVNVVLTRDLKDNEIRQRFGTFQDKVQIKRCPCDTSLINITLPDDLIFEGHDGEMVVRPTAGGSSGDVDLTDFKAVSLNIQMSTFDTDAYNDTTSRTNGSFVTFVPDLIGPTSYKTVTEPFLSQLNQAFPVSKDSMIRSVKIAILDSGLDPNFMNVDGWKTNTTLCNANLSQSISNQGWNFLTNPVSVNSFDDQAIQHGSRVALLAAQQFIGSEAPIHIIPMKVLNSDNKGDLFSILCALETARKNEVDVINMSLGYYGKPNALFEEYINRITNDSIWVVVAAGNEIDNNHKRKLSGMEADSMFYPAMFGQKNKHVLAVTTVNVQTKKVSARQNFDSSFVLGVQADVGNRFKLLNNNRYLIFGTSYATPIVSGLLCKAIGVQKPNSIITPGKNSSPLEEILKGMNSTDIEELYTGKVITKTASQ